MAIGALFGAAGGQVISAGVAYGLQKDAQAHQKNIMKNQKQWLYNDLRAAGINPILAGGATNVSGGAGIASAGTGQDLGAAFRAGKMFKALKRKADSEAITAKNMEAQSWDAAREQTATASSATDDAIMKRMEMWQATARNENIMTGIKSRKELDNVGIPAFGLSGSDMRKFNVILRQFRGQDQNSAGRE